MTRAAIVMSCLCVTTASAFAQQAPVPEIAFDSVNILKPPADAYLGEGAQSENELYVAEVLNWRVQELIVRPDKKTSSDR